MPALTFDDLIPEAPPAAAGGRAASQALTFDDLIPQDKPASGGALEAVKDYGRSILSNLDKGVAGIAGFPADIARGAIALSDLEKAYRSGRPYEQIRDERDRGATIPSTTFDKYGGGAFHDESGLKYEGQTAGSRAVGTIAGFIPGALVGGGLGSVRGIAAQVAAPAAGTLAAQGANSVLGIQGAPAAVLEGAGALAGGGIGSFATRAGQAERAVAQAAGNLSPQVYRDAQALMDDAAQMGVRLTADEAIQQVTGGATRLSELRRVTESSPGGGDVLKPLMAERPGQVQAAGRSQFEGISPNQLDPTVAGARVRAAAEGEIEGTRQSINAATRPDYRAAAQHTLDPADFAPISRDPAFQASLRRLRNDEVLGPQYAEMPDNSVAVIDAVTKDMRDRGIALGNKANPGFNSQTAGMYSSGATEARSIARDPARGGVQAYDDALTAQTQARRQNLEPLENGPVGQIAETSDLAAQGERLLPAVPDKINAEAGIGDAVRRIATRDQQATRSLIRNHVQSAFNEATQNLASGPNQFGGSKFASIIAGNGQQAANLEAAVRALPNGDQRWQGFRRFLDVMEATGKRPAAGSNTSPDTVLRRDLSQGGAAGELVAAVKTGGTSLLKRFNEFREQMNLGGNTAQIANLLTRPDAARLLGQLAETPPNAARAQILALRLSYMGRQGGSREE